VLLPFRLLFYVLLLPFLLLKAVLGGVLMVVLAPIALIALLVGGLAVAMAVIVPLLPLVVLGLFVWFLVRLTRPATAPTRV